jgi:ParB family transcriptional regulator, chromosome partitioning protein
MNDEWPIEQLQPNPNNPRRGITEDPSFDGLVSSIQDQGILQPLLINDDGMILAGHRRYEAALRIGLKHVPVRRLPSRHNHQLVPLIENLQRSNLSVLDVADYLFRCREEFKMTIPMIAQVTGIGTTTISQYLKLVMAPKELRERLERDDITLGAAVAMLSHGERFIHEVVRETNLTRNVVREKAKTFEDRARESKARYLRHITVLEREWDLLEQDEDLKPAAMLIRKTVAFLYNLVEDENNNRADYK